MDRSRKDFLGAIENYKLGLLPQAKLLLKSCVKGDPRHAEPTTCWGSSATNSGNSRKACIILSGPWV
jgi:hypothetical protein